ncbi:MAG: site-specific integrase [Dehalococcoidia bacterium]|nr:site-specific integrase [Dehalococcoidia bacterium]
MNGSIRKRGKDSWELTIDLGFDADGKRKRKFVTVQGKRADADKRLRQLLTDNDKGLPINTAKITVGDWLSRWLQEDVKPQKRIKTYERYESIVRKHVAPAIGHIQLTALTPSHVRTLLTQLSADGMAPAGVDLVRNVVHGALKAAMRLDLLHRNVVDAAPAPKIDRPEIAPPDADAVGKVLALAKSQVHPLFAALHLAAYTGARRGEVLALAWEYVDLHAGTISITRSLDRAKAGLVFEPPKTRNGRRLIDLDQRTIEVLRAHQGRQLLEKMQAEGAYVDQGLVFANALGQPINPMRLTRAFQSLAQQCGLGHVKLHALRHSHATILFAANESLFDVSRRLGHGSIATTADLYGHVLPGHGKKQADAFAHAIQQARPKEDL